MASAGKPDKVIALWSTDLEIDIIHTAIVCRLEGSTLLSEYGKQVEGLLSEYNGLKTTNSSVVVIAVKKAAVAENPQVVARRVEVIKQYLEVARRYIEMDVMWEGPGKVSLCPVCRGPMPSEVEETCVCGYEPERFGHGYGEGMRLSAPEVG